ncbi:universal stress protein [Bacillaceae bacterium]
MVPIASRILVAYDGSDLSKKALETAVKLAKSDEKVEIDVVAVFDPPVALASYGIYNAGEILNEIRKEMEESFAHVEEQLKGLPNKWRTLILEGHPAEMIVRYARENGCDLIVMGSRGLSGIKEFFLGSVSHYVTQRAQCPVLIVK